MGNPSNKKGRGVREQMFASHDWASEYLKGLATSQGASTKKEREQGVAFSDVDLMKMDYEYRLTQEERAYNEEMYNKYQSPAAMMRQYQDAGLNPALMYTGGQSIGAPAAAGGTSSVGMGQPKETNAFDMVASLLSMVQGAASLGNEINKGTAAAEQSRAQANLTNEQAKTEAYKRDNLESQTILNRITAAWQPWLNAANFAESRQRVNESISNVSLQSAQIEKIASEKELNEAKKVLTNLQTDQLEDMFALAKEYQELQNKLLKAQESKEQKTIEQIDKQIEQIGKSIDYVSSQNEELRMWLDNGGTEAEIESQKNAAVWSETGSLNRYQYLLLKLLGSASGKIFK